MCGFVVDFVKKSVFRNHTREWWENRIKEKGDKNRKKIKEPQQEGSFQFGTISVPHEGTIGERRKKGIKVPKFLYFLKIEKSV